MFRTLHAQAVIKASLIALATAISLVGVLLITQSLFGCNIVNGWSPPPEVWFMLLLVSVIAGTMVGVWLEFQANRALRKDLDDIRFGVQQLTEGNLHHRWKEWGVRRTDQLRWQLNQMADRWQEQTRHLQRLADEKEALLLQAREAGKLAERQRLARELHDAVSQQLFAIAMTAAAARRQLGINQIEVGQSLERLEKTAHLAQQEMRALLLQLRPIALGEESLANAIQSILNDIESRKLLVCEAKLGVDEDLTPALASNLLRIFQEAVTNTLRHANAHKLEVILEQDVDTIRLVIADDGVGFVVKDALLRKASYGLATIRERAQECGGQAKVISLPGRGTRISVLVPRFDSQRMGVP